jgi:hypothetical protein
MPSIWSFVRHQLNAKVHTYADENLLHRQKGERIQSLKHVWGLAAFVTAGDGADGLVDEQSPLVGPHAQAQRLEGVGVAGLDHVLRRRHGVVPIHARGLLGRLLDRLHLLLAGGVVERTHDDRFS